MSDQFVNAAQDNMSAIERLLKGLPGIKGYVDKEPRRDADKRLRTMIAANLEEQKRAVRVADQVDEERRALLAGRDGQRRAETADPDRPHQDGELRLRHFDAVKIEAEQLSALHRFDVALAERTAEVESGIQAIGAAVEKQGDIAQAIEDLAKRLNDLNSLVGRRAEAIVSPDLLMDVANLPEVDPKLLDE